MPCDQPLSSIGPLSATNRIKIFTGNKKPILDTIIGPKLEVFSVFYSPGVFRDLLLFITNPAKNYSGLRIYFAAYRNNPKDHAGNDLIPSGKEENLTLIFVPTTQESVNVHKDDLSSCLIIADNKIYVKDPRIAPSRDEDTVSNWIRHYQGFRIPNLEYDGVANAHIPGFKETKSIWYDINFFKSNATPTRPGTGTGLIDYINCLMSETPALDSVEIKFAGYMNVEDFNYQLTLIFAFNRASVQFLERVNQGVEVSYFSFFKGDLRGWDGTDTGNPCPPNTCDENLLPLP